MEKQKVLDDKISDEDLEKLADEVYPLDDPTKNMFHDNSGQYSRREAFMLGFKACLQKGSEDKTGKV